MVPWKTAFLCERRAFDFHVTVVGQSVSYKVTGYATHDGGQSAGSFSFDRVYIACIFICFSH